MIYASASKSKSEQTASLLLAYAQKSNLSVGDKLPSEECMAKMFNVSRVSIREAINGLKFLGLLDAAPRRGTTIASMDYSRLAKYMGFQLAFSAMSEKELLEARQIVEISQVELIAKKMNDHDFAELIRIGKAVRRDNNSPEAIEATIISDFAFHKKLFEVGDNFALLAFSELLESFFDQLHAHPGSIEDSKRAAQEHVIIVEAMHINNIELARGMLKLHFGHHSS